MKPKRRNADYFGIINRKDFKEIIQKAMDRGLLITSAGHNVIRFLPPLIISKKQIDQGIEILDNILGEE